MAELTRISYQYGASLVHRLDVRFKIGFLAAISLSMLNASATALGVLTFFILILAGTASVSLKAVLFEVRYFIFLLLFIFIARSLSVPGPPLATLFGLSISRPGVWQGIMICWRLILIVLLGIIFVVSSSPTEIKTGIQWVLKPVPFIPEKKVGTMIGLTVRFIPVILDQARETMDAQRARGIEYRKNPFFRLIKLVVPLMRRTFLDADRLAMAMESRCYTDDRTEPLLKSSRIDWVSLSAVSSMCAILIFV